MPPLYTRYDIGATSYVVTQLQDSEYSGVSWHQQLADSSFLQGAITSAGVGEILAPM